MPNEVSVRVDGVDELVRKLEKVGRTLGGSLEDALWLGAQPLQSDAKRRSPVDTGNLRASITTERGPSSSKSAQVRVGPGRQAPYGIFVEFGTRRMRAQPFMRPAVKSQKKKVGQLVRKELRRQIEAAV